jgi:Fe-S oxidoreductase
MLKKTTAKRLMNTCTQCGLCDEVCPENIEVGGMLLEARRNLHRQDTMPGAYHQFWVRDMEFTNGVFTALTKSAPGQEQCSYAFFPGCQLGAANPRSVSEPYRWLLSKQPDTGLILRCCSVPAEWAGNETMHDRAIAELREDWARLGKPVLILACAACRKHMKEYLPEIETVTLYELLDQWGFAVSPEEALKRMETVSGGNLSIFDPCTARHAEPLERAVRNLAGKAGIQAEELPKGDMHGCCGYGGHVSEANADYFRYVVKSRSDLSENPYLVYCANCRDVFRGEGKPAIHILDLLFDTGENNGRLPSLSARRQNRVELKEMLLKEIWSESMETKPEPCKYTLKIGADVLDKMDALKILEEDVCRVIELGESRKRRTYNPQENTYTCYRESGDITFWVEYRKTGGIYEVVNVYAHRMKIKLEGVWNGRKTEVDL